MKRSLSVSLIVMLILQTLATGIFSPRAQAQGTAEDLFQTVEYLTDGGESVQNDGTQNITSMNIHWILKGSTVTADQPYHKEIPEPLKVEAAQGGELLAGDEAIGRYTADGEGLNVVFNEAAAEHPEAEGEISISVVSEVEEVEPPAEEETETPVNEEVKEPEAEAPAEEDAVKEETVEDETAEADAPAKEEVKEEDEKEKKEEVKKSAAVDGIITENILTKATLSFEDRQGNPQDKPTVDSLVSVKYEWALKNGHGYKGGDVFKFNMPPELKIYDEIVRSEMRFNDEIVGYFSVNKQGEATVEFTDFIEQFSNIKGTLEVWTELDKETVVTEDKTIVITPIEGQESITIEIDYPSKGADVSKKGEPNRAYNAETIKWTVDFNKNLGDLKNARLEDPIREGQELKEGSIKLYHLETKLNGETTLGSEVSPGDYTIGKTAGGQDFAIDFNDDIHLAYRLVYETNVTDEDQTDFKNKATLTSDGGEKSAEATVKVQRGQPLQKRVVGYDAAKQLITWEVRYNYNQKNIAQKDAVLEDFFNGSQELLKDTLTVNEITINENGNESGSTPFTNYDVVDKSDGNRSGFTLQFKQDIDAAYKITYQTKAIDRVYENENIVNEVTTGEIRKDAGQTIGQQILFKHHGSPNYKDKTIPWTINFNLDEQLMKNVVLKDDFTNKGLTFKRETLKIETKGKTLMEGTDYTLEEVEDGFEIVFLKDINTSHRITYTTAFDYEKRADKGKKYLENKAELLWKDEQGKDRTLEAISRFTPDSYTQFNGFKDGSYNAVDKLLTWNVGVNYNLKQLEQLRVVDYMQGNQKLVEDSIAVYRMDLTGGGNGTKDGERVPASEYTVKMIDNDKGEQGFEIIFKNPVDSPYKITYKTSVKDVSLVQSSYKNTATVYDGEKKETDLNASVSIPNGDTYTAKSGKQNGKVIDWKININFGQSTVQKARILDTPSPNQMLIKDSFKLYSTTVEPNGNVKKKEELTEGKDYVLTLKEDPDSFTIDFKEEVSTPYILEYQSLILEKVGGKVSNTVDFKGENAREDVKKGEASIIVQRTGGKGDGSGEVGGLKVKKVDKETGDVLKGATFSLKDPVSGVTIATATSDQDGIATFNRLLYGDYTLMEESAPDGYLKGFESKEVTIDQPYDPKDDAKPGNTITVDNTKIKQQVELTKIDEETKSVLPGAVFDLKNSKGEVVRSDLKTDDSGMIVVKDLEPGTYTFVETQAPEGYKGSGKEYEVTIKKDQTEFTTITVTNDIIRGGIELTKVSEDGTTLKDAVFKLVGVDVDERRDNLTTDEDGKLVITDLRPGSYELIETQAPKGHDLKSEPLTFEIVKGQTEHLKLTFENDQTTGSVRILKVGEEGKKLEGVTFDLQKENGEELRKGLTTNANGILLVEDLKPGNYKLVEKQTLDGYLVGKDPVHPFTIELGQEKTLEITITNDLKRGAVELTKLGEDKEKLADAVFKLLDADGKEVKTDLKTDESGIITVTDLLPGTYSFVETAAPKGHVLDETPLTFAIPFDPKEPVKITKENERSTSSVVLEKMGEDDKLLEGVTFDLVRENGEPVQGGTGLKTNAEGKIQFDGLKPGKYQFIETSSIDGYVLGTGPISFEIKLGQETATKVKVINELKTGSVQLQKVGEEKEALEGAEFTLRNKETGGEWKGLTTDADGIITVDNLKPGHYQFIETKAPFGHVLDETPVDVEVVFDPDQELPATVTMENERATGSVILTKKGEEGNTLEGVKFDLWRTDGTLIAENLTTDENGVLKVDDLKPGSYQFVETETLAGYDLPSEPIPFEIELGQETALNVEVINDLTTGSVLLTKIDEEGYLLEGALFDLTDGEGNVLATDLETDEDGELFIDGLKPGNYQLIETQAPYGYELDDEPIPFEIVKGQQETLEIVFENLMILGNLKILKVDSQTDRKLQGAEFDILDENGEILLSVATDEEGEAYIEGLVPGTYSLVETKAPGGYVASNEPIPFTVEVGQEGVITIVVKNDAKEKPPEEPEKPTTPSEPTTPTKPSGPSEPASGTPMDSTPSGTPKNTLPYTGEEWMRYLMYAGLLFISAGTIVITARRKRGIEE